MSIGKSKNVLVDKNDFGEKIAESAPLHQKARLEKGNGYPERFAVPDEVVAWNAEYAGYAPPYYVAPSVLENDETTKAGDTTGKNKGWAQTENVSDVPKEDIRSYEELRFDDKGRPMNPRGRTGIEGRGLLGKWGANFAADPIITRENPDTGEKELLVIRRKDNGNWALPGGMVDTGEKISQAASRELKEEAGIDVDMNLAAKVYEGYVDDPRNTDNAWMETVAYHLHLSPEQARQAHTVAGDDAVDVKWMPLTPESMNALHASHADLVRLAVGS